MAKQNFYEYVCDITKNGSSVFLTKEVLNEFVQRSNDGRGGFTNITLYQEGEATPQQRKEREANLEAVTMCALCCDEPDIFFEHISLLFGKKFENVGYDAGDWGTLLSHLWISCSMVLTRMVIVERFQKSAKVLLEILQTRIKEWRKKSEGTIKKELDKDGNPTGGFVFKMVGEIL